MKHFDFDLAGEGSRGLGCSYDAAGKSAEARWRRLNMAVFSVPSCG